MTNERKLRIPAAWFALALLGAAPAAVEAQPREMDPRRATPPVRVDGKVRTMDEALEPGAEPASKDEYVHVLLRIGQDGSARVLSATKLPGTAVVSGVRRGDFLYEVKRDSETVAVESIPDPFEQRSFAPKDQPEKGHHISRAPTADIVVKMPAAEAGDLSRIAIRVYRLKPQADVTKIDAATVRSLAARNLIERKIDVPAQRLGPQLREKLKVVAPR